MSDSCHLINQKWCLIKYQCRMNRDLLRYEAKLTYQGLWSCETQTSKPKECSTPRALRSSGLGVIDLQLKMGKLESMKGKTLHSQ